MRRAKAQVFTRLFFFKTVSYFTLQNLTALIPLTYLTDGLSDDLTLAGEAFAEVQGLTESRVNGMLASRYAVPITPGDAGADAFLKDVCVLIAAAMVYTRRGIQPENWPFKGEHSSAMARLRAISKGEEPLVVNLDRAKDAAEIISESARSYSRNLAA